MNEYGFKGEVIITSSNYLYDRLYHKFYDKLSSIQGKFNNKVFVIDSDGAIFYRYTDENLITYVIILTKCAKLSMKMIDFKVVCVLHIDNQLIYTSTNWE